MDTRSLIQIPGYVYNEYLLVISPPPELLEKIKRVKQDFYDKYQSENALWGRPHITLINFIQFEMIEERIANRLRAIGMGYTPFQVELKNFGSFPCHTIYINVESQLPVKNLIRALRSARQLLKLNKENTPHYFDAPHITVARNLQPWQYEKGWLDFQQKHFTGRFIASSMLLIKRRAGTQKYQVVERFEFMNMPVATTQGALFI
ncbi:MAG TPA: 2'-5' RNA ligase family protein [Chitinophagaceae bacterium]|nr:2'-5' RNA ligase family protein [Chitinophagaceae bacterium]